MSTQNFSNKVEQAIQLIENADYVLIGAGAGFSAAGGLDYSDPELFEKWFPQLVESGINTLWEGLSSHWYMKESNKRRFWGYWANHINKIRYESPVLTPYKQLYELLKNKNYFVITTNVDYQFYKAGFDPNKIYAPQGDYAFFQCERACIDVVYPNKPYIDQMVSGTDFETLEVREEDIPICPNCGAHMSKNIRIDHTFVEAPHLENQDAYYEFINKSVDGKLVLLELGVGFNTPIIIRWPFEKVTSTHPKATLIRMNMNKPEVSDELKEKSLTFDENITDIFNRII